MYARTDKYDEIAAEVIEGHKELHWLRDVSICYMSSDKPKKGHKSIIRADCHKVQERYKDFCPFDYLVTVYEPNVEGFSDRQIGILLHHELLHINRDGSLNPHDVNEFRQIIEEYGADWDA